MDHDALCGRALGEFVLRERIGEGGFGAVYRCEQPLLGREAVIKVLHHALRDSEIVLQRFMREAQLASRLDHPYAAHIYAFGVEKDDGLFWIAMELVHGTGLDIWLRDRGPLPLSQLVPFFERVAEVVQTAHERGIVHRDLKPSNIMVIERAGRLLPKLLDFGIAKVLGPDNSEPAASPAVSSPGSDEAASATALDVTAKTVPSPPPRAALVPSEVATLAPGDQPVKQDARGAPLTQANATIGSPPYMSPEQWTDATTVGPRADLYALGVVAYEAVTGRRPFSAPTVPALAFLHCNEAVPPLGAGFPPALDRFFERAMAKRPEDRPATALELAAMLRAAAGFGVVPEDLPRLDEAVRDTWLAEAPQSLAEGVAALDGARNAHQARDAARDLFRGLIRYFLVIALSARAQVRTERDDPSVRELLRALRARELDEDERIKLLRLLVRPFAERPGTHPVPELVALLVPHADSGDDALDPVLRMRPSTDHAGTEDIVRSQVAQLVTGLSKLMRASEFVLDYALVVPQDGVPERWMGLRRQHRTLAVVREVKLVEGQPLLIDREGRFALALFPLLQVAAPSVGVDLEMFAFEGRGRHGARLSAAPANFDHYDPGVWDWFADNVLGELDREAGPGRDDRAPFLGLASFATADADRFVGREREIDAFINRLRRQALQIVVGPSGAGKSSFIHAGVVPGLPVGWRAISLRPGVAPLTTLASKLASAGHAADELRALFAHAPDSAAVSVTRAAGRGEIVIVVDQLEELFTLCDNVAERMRFATVLARLSAAPDGATRVVCTVRDDFLMHVEALVPLRPVLSPALFLLGNPSRDDLARTIVEPARRAGYALSDDELARDMVDAVADRPGALALLSFTASRLWELRDRRFRQLTRKAYDAMGGVGGALGQHAETTFSALVHDDQRIAREAFRHLVTADKTRAVLAVDELRQRLASSRADTVIDQLVAARLLAVDGEAESHIEIIHEALISAWPRLLQWTRENTADTRTREQAVAAAKQWDERRRPRELLWRGDLLAELERLRARVALTELELAFANASRDEAARGRRLRRAIVTATLVISAVFLVVLWRANGIAQDERGKAEALLRDSMFDQGRLRMLQGDKLGALPLLNKAYRMGETGSANRLLIEEALRPTRARAATLEGHIDKLWDVVYSPDGKLIATASADGTARLWDATTGNALEVIHLDGAAEAVAFSPDSKLLAVGGRDITVRLWDVTGRRQIAALGVTATIHHVMFSPNGSLLLAAGPDDRDQCLVRIWSMPDGKLVRDLAGHHGVVGAAFSADGKRLATWDDYGHAMIWDSDRFTEQSDVKSSAGFRSGAVDRTGAMVALGTANGELDVLHPDGRTSSRPALHAKAIGAIAISPDGATIATASDDATAELWDVASASSRASLVGNTARITVVRFSPDGKIVVTACSDGSVRLWTVSSGLLLGQLGGHANEVSAVALAPDGARAVTASWDHRAILWDMAAAQQFQPIETPFDDNELPTSNVSYGPDGHTIAMITRDKSLAVVDGGHVTCHAVAPIPVFGLAWSRDGSWIATTDSVEPSVRIWSSKTCALIAEIAQPARVLAIAVSPTGQLAAGGEDAVWLWDVPRRHLDATIDHLPGGVVAIDFDADGGWLFAATYGLGASTITAEQLAAPHARTTFDAGKRYVTGIALDARRDRLLASSQDQYVRIWDLKTGTLTAKLEGTGALFGVRLSSDGKLIVAVGGSSPTVWDAENLSRVGSLEGHSDQVVRGSFLGDRLFVTASRDDTARLWDLATLRPLLIFGGADAVDGNHDGTSWVLSDVGGAREWSPRFPVPDLSLP